MYKVTILTIGKNKESWLAAALDEYTRRLRPHCQIDWQLAKNDAHLEELAQSPYLALDPDGRLMTSPDLAAYLMKAFETHGTKLSLLIGGPAGLTPRLKQNALATLSFSPLTFTHQLTRLILLEQLYRAFQIHLGTPYHK